MFEKFAKKKEELQTALDAAEEPQTALDATIEEFGTGDKDLAVRTIISLYENNRAMFEDKEDQVIEILRQYPGEDVRRVLEGLQTQAKAKEAAPERPVAPVEAPTREMPAVKVSEGSEELIKAKRDFEKIHEDVDDLRGYIGAVRMLAQNAEYAADPEFVQKLLGTIRTIDDAVSVWKDPGEKRELESRYQRLLGSLPPAVAEQIEKRAA